MKGEKDEIVAQPDSLTREMALILKATMNDAHRFNDFQRARDGETLGDRERLLLKRLQFWEKKGVEGMPTIKLAIDFNEASFTRMEASPATINTVGVNLENQGYVKRIRRGKEMVLSLDVKGREFLAQEEKRKEERVKIYNTACPNPEDKKIVMKFCIETMRDFNRRMSLWRKGVEV